MAMRLAVPRAQPLGQRQCLRTQYTARSLRAVMPLDFRTRPRRCRLYRSPPSTSPGGSRPGTAVHCRLAVECGWQRQAHTSPDKRLVQTRFESSMPMARSFASWLSKFDVRYSDGSKGDTMRMFLPAAAFAFAANVAQAQQACQLTQLDSIPMTVGADGLTIPVTVNGITKDFDLAIQNPSNVVNERGAKELEMDYRPLPAARKNAVFRALAQNLRIGKITGSKVPFYLIAPSPEQKNDFHIGSGLFQNFDIELDMAGGKLNLFSPNHCAGNAVYWTKPPFATLPLQRLDYGFATIEMQLDGKNVRAALGTGADSHINMKAFKRIFALDENSPGITMEKTTDSGAKIYRYEFKNMTVDGLTIANPKIKIEDVPGQSDCGVPASHCVNAGDVTLGISILRQLHLYISQKENIIYVTPAAAH